MGLSLSLLSSAWNEILAYNLVGLMDAMGAVRTKAIIADQKDERMASRTNSFLKEEDSEFDHKKAELERSLSLSNWESDDAEAKASDKSSKKSDIGDERSCDAVPVKVKPHDIVCLKKPTISVPEPVVFFSPRPMSELDAAATKVQKVYKSYRTRRNLADCAVVVEELWWKALDFAALKRSSVSFFNDERQETAVSRWSRARTKAAKVGKGLLKDEKAQKLALQHWLEAIDPRHRYGHNLHLYYDVWSESKSTQPFFYWLDIGDGKEINVEKCPRIVLQRQCIKYLGPKEREEYEVIVESGKLVFSQSGMLVNTTETSKWIFVLSTARSLYVGQKKKGVFQHSSFLSGGATTAAGRLVAHDGVLEAIWPYSGHYLPTEDNFKEFIIFLEEHNVDLSNVKRYSIDDDNASYNVSGEKSKPEEAKIQPTTSTAADTEVVDVNVAVKITSSHQGDSAEAKAATMDLPVFDMAMAKRLSCKWTSGVGPRIGCVRDYPAELQSQALEQVNLSPRVSPGHLRNRVPIPSPRPSPKIRVSPRLSYMGLPSPMVTATAAC